MGSEMCIRDRGDGERAQVGLQVEGLAGLHAAATQGAPQAAEDGACLLYTSDAADERSSVDLGGRRIIKKTKTGTHSVGGSGHTRDIMHRSRET